MQLLFNVLFQFSIIAVIACSFFLIFNPTRYFHVAHAVTMLVCPYTMLQLDGSSALSWSVKLLVALLSTGFFAVVVGGFYRLFGSGKSSPVNVLVFSLGVYIITQNVLSIIFGDQIKRLNICEKGCDHLVQLGLLPLASLNQVYILSFCITTLLLLNAFWYRTKYGRYARAISDNRELAQIVGIPVEKTVLILTFISALGAGVAGLAIVYDTGITPSAGLSMLMPGLIAVIIGGNRSMVSTMVGAVFITLVKISTAYLLGSKWVSFFIYFVLIFALLLKPDGFIAINKRVEQK